MQYTRETDRRRSVRLPSWDYRDTGAYFVTICAYRRKCIFSDRALTRILEDVWVSIPDHFPAVSTDAFVVMPNHIHGIIWIQREQTVGARHDAPLRLDALRPAVLLPGSLGAIVLQFKSAAAKRVNLFRRSPGAPVWQRNYYERVLRQSELDRAREYILDNPRKWAEDKHNPAVFRKTLIR